MLERLRVTYRSYPRPYWVLFWGNLINSTGGSMIWPFLTIYMRQSLGVPLTTITLLLTVNSAAGLVSTSFAGPAVDRFGRKGAMILGLVLGGASLYLMSLIASLPMWTALMLLSGAANPLLRVGSNAMVADLVEPERRAEAYALLRMINNLGVAVGPAVGGFVAVISYSYAFYAAAGVTLLFALLILLLVPETMPQLSQEQATQAGGLGGYGPILQDHPFLAYCGALALAGMAYSLMMVLLPVYAKENYGVPENQYGFIMATNAAMVVFLQYGTTRLTERFPAMGVLAAGSFFYALGVGSVALGAGFTAFLLSMVVLTVGEMIIIPTATALTANLAPPDMRGRYMGVYALTWGVGFGVGPVVGGLLNDHVAPVAIWYSGFIMALAAAAMFLALARRVPPRRAEAGPGARDDLRASKAVTG